MFKPFALIFVLLSFLSCGVSKNADENNSIQMEEADLLTSPLKLNFKTNIEMIDFDQEQEKILKATELIRKVIVSDKFRRAVLNHKYEEKKAFADNRGLTNSQIYRKILEGSEKLTPGKDYEMDMVLLTYYEDVITIGYTYPNTRKVWMNRKYLDKFSPVQVTGNMMHEWLHKLGFGHALTQTPERRYSVPYAVGYIMQRLAREEFRKSE